MADVIELAQGEHPPADLKWVLVIVDSSATETRFLPHGSGVTYMTHKAVEKGAIKSAQAYAAAQGISNVYVQRRESA